MSIQSNKGKTLQAIEVSQHEAVGVATLNELEHFGVKSPSEMASMPLNKKTDKADASAKELRYTIQRTWDKTRHGRADLYKQYLLQLSKGTIMGAAPPVTIYVDKQGVPSSDGTIHFPYLSTAITIDGETQLEARFRLRAEEPETGDMPFAITLHHGKPAEHGVQILHDYNCYAHPIPESKLGSKNSSGGMSQTIADAISKASVINSIDDLNRSGNAGTKKFVASYRQAMSFVASYAVGKDALKRNATTWFAPLNAPGAAPVDSGCPDRLAALIDLAAADPRISLAAPLVWQVAGVLGAEGRDPKTLHWDAGFAAFTASAPKTRGKVKVAERLEAVYNGLK